MNQIIEKDVIKGLECCAIEVKNLFDDELPCKDCPYLQKPCRQLIKDAYNLINRQQHQLDNYSRKVKTMAKDICRYKANIDRLKDKNLELLNKLLPYEEYPPLENIIEEKESDTE